MLEVKLIIQGPLTGGIMSTQKSRLLSRRRKSLQGSKTGLPDGSAFIFLEIKDVYKTPDSVSGMMVIKKTPLPCDIKELGVVREKVIHGMDSISF